MFSFCLASFVPHYVRDIYPYFCEGVEGTFSFLYSVPLCEYDTLLVPLCPSFDCWWAFEEKKTWGKKKPKFPGEKNPKNRKQQQQLRLSSLCRKHSVLPYYVPFLWVSFTDHTKHIISNTSGHQMNGLFPPHQTILCNTSWVSYDLTQF